MTLKVSCVYARKSFKTMFFLKDPVFLVETLLGALGGKKLCNIFAINEMLKRLLKILLNYLLIFFFVEDL